MVGNKYGNGNGGGGRVVIYEPRVMTSNPALPSGIIFADLSAKVFKSKLIKMTLDTLSDNGSLAALLHNGHLMMEIVKPGAKKSLFRVNWSKNGRKAF